MENNKVCLIVLEHPFDGDCRSLLVDEATFAWVTDEDTHGRFEGSSSWKDNSTPKFILDAIIKNTEGDEDGVYLTAGTYINDRALYLGEEQICCCYSKAGAQRFAKKKGYEIVSTYEGGIY